MKKFYIKPMTTVIHTLQQGFICESDVRSIRSNDDVEIEYGGAGNGDAFVKENYHYNVWDDNWSK